MRRVLMVCPHGERGGVARVAVALARGLPEHGLEAVPALLARGPLEDELAAVGRPGIVLAKGGRRRARGPLRIVPALARLAREREAALVLTHGTVGQLYGAPAALRARLPAIWWYHGSGGRPVRWHAAASLPAAAVVSVNDAMVDAQRRRTPRTRVLKITPGLPVDEVAAHRGTGRDVRASLGWKELAVVGMVGRLERWKGHVTFLHAAAQVAERNPHVRFAVVGAAVPGRRGQAHATALRRTADELGLAERIHFAGDQQEPYAWLDAFDVAVHASTHEPFGLVVLEAMALGTPLIAADVRGPADIVEHNVSGLLVPPDDSHGLAREIVHLLEDRALGARLAQAARERARQFSEHAMVARFAALVDEVAPRRS
jgi:glycosyltransferase involved in cell wall biosynthesis